MGDRTIDLVFNRHDLGDIDTVSAVHARLNDGEVRLRIDRFALTANNVTYAIAPEQIGYWNFFPAEREGWGRVPVWGFAEVIETRHDAVPGGTRVYGYFPMSTHLVVQPGKLAADGFSDMSAHRQPMAAIYNRYSYAKADTADQEGLISLFRPLFTTSWLLEDWHRREWFFGAERILLSSASSKTALGLAFLLHRNRPAGLGIVGLTSAGNRSFVEGLGYYDEVAGYDEVERLDTRPTAFVDMAGDADLLRRVHGHFREALKNSCRVGLTHWQTTSNWVENLEGGPKPAFFFAPTYAQDRLSDWGREEFAARLADATAAFMKDVGEWVRIENSNGPDAVKAVWRKLVSGRIDPAAGHVLSMWA